MNHTSRIPWSRIRVGRLAVCVCGLVGLGACGIIGPEDGPPLTGAFASEARPDTLSFAADGSGERRTFVLVQAPDGGEPDTVAAIHPFTHRAADDGILLTMACPPGAACITGPHYRAEVRGEVLTLAPMQGSLEPIVRFTRID